MLRYLPADQVELPTTMRFTEPGHCEWCNEPLSGRATKYCRLTEEEKSTWWEWSRIPSHCTIAFSNWWYANTAFKRAVLIRDSFTCQKCGYHEMQEERPWLPRLDKLHIDHITPLSRGGETETPNLQVLCRDCNLAKGTSMVAEEPTPEEGRRRRLERPVYLTNESVAWEIPPGRIARFYLWGLYRSLPGWRVTKVLEEIWYVGECGELRRDGCHAD